MPPGVSATLLNNTANSSIDLNLTAVPGFRWTGAVNGDWDFATANWLNQQSGSSSVYSDNFPTELAGWSRDRQAEPDGSCQAPRPSR